MLNTLENCKDPFLVNTSHATLNDFSSNIWRQGTIGRENYFNKIFN